MLLAQRLQDRQPVHARQREIEKHEVEVGLALDRLERLLRIGRLEHGHVWS